MAHGHRQFPLLWLQQLVCGWVMLAQLDNKTCDLTSAPFNPRTRVHEYGGGSWWVSGQYLYFVHWDDQRLYRVDHVNVQNSPPVPITPEPDVAQAWRYADGCVSPDGQWIVCVRESVERCRGTVLNLCWRMCKVI